MNPGKAERDSRPRHRRTDGHERGDRPGGVDYTEGWIVSQIGADQSF